MLTWITKCLLWECLGVISCFDEFIIHLMPRHATDGVNILTHQTSGYNYKRSISYRRPMLLMPKCVLWTDWSNRFMRPVWPDSKTGLTTCKTGLTIFSSESTKSAMLIQNHDAVEVSVSGHSFISRILAVEVRHYFIFIYVLTGDVIKMPKVNYWQ